MNPLNLIKQGITRIHLEGRITVGEYGKFMDLFEDLDMDDEFDDAFEIVFTPDFDFTGDVT